MCVYNISPFLWISLPSRSPQSWQIFRMHHFPQCPGVFAFILLFAWNTNFLNVWFYFYPQVSDQVAFPQRGFIDHSLYWSLHPHFSDVFSAFSPIELSRIYILLRKVKELVAQSCLTLCMTLCILQAGILEWVASPFSRASSWPRNWTWLSCIAGRFFCHLSHQGSPYFTYWFCYLFIDQLFQRISSLIPGPCQSCLFWKKSLL